MQHLIGRDPQLMLCKDSRGRTPLHNACHHGHTEVVQAHVETASDINLFEVIDADGNTPLHLACVGGCKAVVKLLVDHGASVTAVNSKGETSVHTSAQHESDEIMELLLDKGGNTVTEVKDKHGCTPLHHAAKNNQTKIITFLNQR